ncbi:MAG: hypothetical protein M3Q65_04690 [Chloroflexota bacterium]|nr:hypothetical protein [Chloroflexota bacterium]
MNWWWHTEADTPETADRSVLALDTRVFGATLAGLCGGPVLPYRLADATREIADLLARYEEAAGSRLVETGAAPDRADARTVVARQKRVSRALVPLRCTLGDRFDHGPTMPAPALPALRDVGRLAKLPSESDEAYFLTTALVRRTNATRHALHQATEAAREHS